MTDAAPRRSGVRLETLDERACLDLLAGHPHQLGRIAFQVGARLVVLPLTYRLHRGAVVFRTALTSVLDEVRDGDRVAFQVDAVDPTWQEGWSVLIDGLLYEVNDASEAAELELLPLRAWAPGERGRLCRIEPLDVTGRRIV